MSKSSLCASIVVLLGMVGVANAQNVGSAQHHHPAVQQSYYGMLYPHYQASGYAHIKPCPTEKWMQNCCCPAGKCQPGIQACCAVKPCPQECPEAMKPCAEPVAPCKAKVEPCSKPRVEPPDCEFTQAMKQVEAMHELAREAEKRGFGDVAHHLRVKAEEMERSIHRQRDQRERQEHLQRMHQEHAELGQAAKCQMQAAQELQREARHLAEQIKLTEQQMRKPRS